MDIALTDRDFVRFRELVAQQIGVELNDSKRALVANRLAKRLRACQLTSYSAYYDWIVDESNVTELQAAMDAITTNETYFWREEKHFDFLKQKILPQMTRTENFRVWSAASSTGEEPYSLAMLLATHREKSWELLASDVSESVLRHAVRAVYSDDRCRLLPKEYLHRFCLKGEGPEEGYIKVVSELRKKIVFAQINLHKSIPDIGLFDLVLLRNVLIYFDYPVKKAIVYRVVERLAPNAHLFVGHSENLHGLGLDSRLRQIQPAIYQLIS